MQCQKGKINSPIRKRLNELALCQRYYEKSYLIDVAPGTPNDWTCPIFLAVSSSDFYCLGKQFFKVTKRVTPMILCYNPSTGAAGNFYQKSVGTGGNSGTTNVSTSQFRITCTNNALTTTAGYLTHWTAEAEL